MTQSVEPALGFVLGVEIKYALGPCPTVTSLLKTSSSRNTSISQVSLGAGLIAGLGLGFMADSRAVAAEPQRQLQAVCPAQRPKHCSTGHAYSHYLAQRSTMNVGALFLVSCSHPPMTFTHQTNLTQKGSVENTS